MRSWWLFDYCLDAQGDSDFGQHFGDGFFEGFLLLLGDVVAGADNRLVVNECAEQPKNLPSASPRLSVNVAARL